MKVRFICAALSALLLAGCSGMSTSSVPLGPATNAQATVRHDVGRGGIAFDSSHCSNSVVYVVSGNGAIVTYDRATRSHTPCGGVNGLMIPEGLFVDGHRHLWVADAGTAHVYELVPGKLSPARTLSDPNGKPSGVTVDNTKHIVYVAEYQNTAQPQAAVEVYENGNMTPTRTLTDPDMRNGDSVTLDNQGNVYATFMTQSNHGQVDRWMGGNGAGQNLGLKLVGSGGIIATNSGLAVCDHFAFRCGVFAPGETKMRQLFGHMGRGHGGIQPNKEPWLMPTGLSLSPDGSLAYVSSNSLTIWNFPGRGYNHLPLHQFKVPNQAEAGIAVSPAAAAGAPY